MADGSRDTFPDWDLEGGSDCDSDAPSLTDDPSWGVPPPPPLPCQMGVLPGGGAGFVGGPAPAVQVGGSPELSRKESEQVQQGGSNSNAHLYVFTNEKSGMQGCDKELQQRVIDELSRGSKHFQHAQSKDAKLMAKVEALRSRLSQMTPAQATLCGRRGAELIAQAEGERRSTRWCCVLDMDMFYAAVEIKDNPSLKDKPVAVGGLSMISTTNYIARQYGVRAAMPGFIGKELCRRQGVELLFVHSGFKRYSEESKKFKSVVERYGPYSSHSVDEVSLDLTSAVRSAADAERERIMQEGGAPPPADTLELAAAGKLLSEIRNEICVETGGLTASGCLAPNFMLAKMGADVNKPDGQFIAPRTRDDVLAWMRDIPVRKIPFVGKVTERLLKESLGIHTAKDIIDNAARVVFALEGGKQESFLIRSALGIAKDELSDYSNKPEGSVARQTVGAERTFASLTGRANLEGMLRTVAAKAAAQLEEQGLPGGKTVILKLKRSDFTVLTRQAPMSRYVRTEQEIYAAAHPLLLRAIGADAGLSLRLMGVRVAKFANQVSYTEARDTTQKRIDTFFKKPAADPPSEGAGGGTGAADSTRPPLPPPAGDSSGDADVVCLLSGPSEEAEAKVGIGAEVEELDGPEEEGGGRCLRGGAGVGVEGAGDVEEVVGCPGSPAQKRRAVAGRKAGVARRNPPPSKARRRRGCDGASPDTAIELE